MDLEFRPLRTDDDFALAEQFKRATVRDVMGNDALFDVWFPADTNPYEQVLARYLAEDPASCVLVYKDGVVVGGLDVRVREGKGHIGNIYLKPEWRGQGLGDVLDAYAVAYFKARGIPHMTLKTHPRQPKLIAFYERVGWLRGAVEANGMMWMEKTIG